ncbi:N-methyl-L-tryptophan oxidase [Corynebacterium pacaense]|uniref:N-methyl-L-tryptophan oxidase n=1 Tax=Corynebacterium pacaense TaxID=1816684 RepID=UPI001FEA44A0|nr:N-methyl-L-tryptophan oxidase [Corynebacterium pacaense]
MTEHGTQVDIAVIGAGSMGAMALWQLTEQAAEGTSILGIEKHGRIHTKGSYSGESRLFRVALKEGGQYVPLAMEARELWNELSRRSGRDVFLPIGALNVGPADLPDILAVREVIAAFDLDHEILDAGRLRAQFPPFDVDDDDIGILDPAGGGLRPELAVATAQQLAIDAGAVLWDNTDVTSIEQIGDTVVINSSAGIVEARSVIVATGSWTGQLIPELREHIAVTPIPLTWYLPLDIEAFTPEHLPVFLRDIVTGDTGFHVYGAPTLDGYSVKISPGVHGHTVDTPDEIPADLTREELELFAEQAGKMVTGIIASPVRVTMHHDGFTPDSSPIIDVLPGTSITVVAGMSGRGMKFAPAYGRMAAELALTGRARARPDSFTVTHHITPATS